ncbi:MAG: hypothetical protein IKN71_04545 [Alphaproteobacteria bacterium]|nr:hypothetical protein [Alphaproteobacteria bacterium]
MTDWVAISAIGTCCSAFATFCACIIALWQTRYNNRKELKIFFNEYVLLSHPMIPKEEQIFVGATIINKGNRPVNITEWSFELKNNKKSVLILNYKKTYLTQLPITIEPEQKVELYYERHFFEHNISELIDDNLIFKNKKIKFSIRDATGKVYVFYSNKKAEKYIKQNKN